MTYSYPEIRNFAGLHLQANSFEVPDGALEEAKNCAMTKDGILAKRRGFYTYLASTGDTLNQLSTFDNKLLTIYINGVSTLSDTGTSPNETGERTDLSGETVVITGTRVSRTVESNKNFYFTTDNGVYKLESSTSSVFKSGIPPALDLRGDFLAENGPIAGGSATSDGSQVAYRVVFGRRDLNDNLLLGSPSDILGFSNAKVTGVSWARVSNVVTVTAGSGHNLVTGMVVGLFGSAAGVPEIVDGSYTITGTTATTYTVAETAADSTGTVDYTANRKARLEYSIPSEIDSTTDTPFVQIYRTSKTNDVDTSPTADFKLVTERNLTASEVSFGLGTYDDGIDDILLGAELYTNPNSREGELQANDRPPLCEDLALYKENVFYANTTSRHILSLDVIDSTTMVAGDYVEIQTVDTGIRRYIAREGVGNSLVTADSVSGTTTITVTYVSHGLAVGDTVFINSITGTLTEGTYTLTAVAATTFDFVAAVGLTATALDFQGVQTLSGGTLFPMFQLDITTVSLAVRLRNTAQGLVKSINRDSSSVIYAKYTSGIVGVPGKMRYQAKGFGGAIQVRSSSNAVGEGFSPTLSTSFTETESTNDNQPNALAIGKISEPEGVPFINFILSGARNKGIFRIAPLRDSLIVIKQDGVYRITGDDVGSYVSTALDTTVICVAPSSVQVINNQVIMLSNQGFCLITENSVQIISRVIEDVIQPLLGLADISTATSGVAFETDRLYICSTLETGGTGDPTISYVYNILNGAWTSWDEVFSQAAIDPSDSLHTISVDNEIMRQRKKQTKLDFSGQNYDITVTAVDTANQTATITSTVIDPEVDWILVLDDVINRITSVTSLGSNSFLLSFQSDSAIASTGDGWGLDAWGNFEWGDPAPLMYAGYETRIKFSPFHGGLVGRFKQFAQMQIHQRGSALSGIGVSFGGAYSPTSAVVDWTALGNSDAGWGLGFWAQFGWGDTEGISILTGTQPGSIVRVYIPVRQQRTTFIQPILEHTRAAEEMNLQALTFAVRAFQERVSR